MQKWQRLAFLLKAEIKGTLPGSDKIILTSSSLQGVSWTSGYPCQCAVKANLETDTETDEEVIRRDETLRVNRQEELEQLSQTTGLIITLGRLFPTKSVWLSRRRL